MDSLRGIQIYPHIFYVSKRRFVCVFMPLEPLKNGILGDSRGKRVEGGTQLRKGRNEDEQPLGERKLEQSCFENNSRNLYCIMCSVIISLMSVLLG